MDKQNNEIDLASELKKFNDSMLPFLKEVKELRETVEKQKQENNSFFNEFVTTCLDFMEDFEKKIEELEEKNKMLQDQVGELYEINQRLDRQIDDFKKERNRFEESCILFGEENKNLEQDIEDLRTAKFERERNRY